LKVPFPKNIQIETTILCIGNCTYCPQKQIKRRPFFMPDDMIHKIIDDSRGEGVIFRPFLQNEPFTDKRMPEIIRYIKKDPTASVEINTNAGLLNRELSEALIDAGMDCIRFSIDGFSQETFNASGKGTEYDKVKENVIMFLELAKKKAPSMQTYVRMVDMDINKHEQNEYIDFWSRYTHAQIVPLYSWPWMGQTGCIPRPCPKIRDEMFFCVDGNAVLCCWDFDERAIIGNISDASVGEIWNGEKNRSYRELLSQSKREEITLCSRCDGFATYDFSSWPGY
jgi:radical SAM protein with 4Fe4S-binding SPASM domain